MTDLLAQGSKTVQCKHGHLFQIPFQTTITKCPTCDCDVFFSFHGTVIDKNDNYVY